MTCDDHTELGNALGLLRLAQQGRAELASTMAGGIPGLNQGGLPIVHQGMLDGHHLASGASDWGGGDPPMEQDGEDAEAGPSSGAAGPSDGPARRPARDGPGSVPWAQQGLQDRFRHLHDCVTGGESTITCRPHLTSCSASLQAMPTACLLCAGVIHAKYFLLDAVRQM